jgi:pimeloyl-ACP methyl ester carboxylesterase
MTRMHRFAASDGATIAFADTGEGLPLLCLSGLTRNATDFDYMLPHLPPGWRVIRMDYRGRGQSDWTGAATYTVPREGRDALELLDHLGLARAAVLGTSRGGMIGMFLGAVAHDRLAGLCLNDVGPQLEWEGLARIKDYVGRNPAAKTVEAFARALPAGNPGMDNVPESRWLEEAQRHAQPDGKGGLRINYDPALRDSFLAAFEGAPPDLWPLFDACAGLPLALLRGANSDLLSPAVVAEMRARRPDLMFAEVPDRAHIPFLDEPVSVALLHSWLSSVQAAGRL